MSDERVCSRRPRLFLEIAVRDVLVAPLEHNLCTVSSDVVAIMHVSFPNCEESCCRSARISIWSLGVDGGLADQACEELSVMFRLLFRLVQQVAAVIVKLIFSNLTSNSSRRSGDVLKSAKLLV
jgi:hypothetical protein